MERTMSRKAAPLRAVGFVASKIEQQATLISHDYFPKALRVSSLALLVASSRNAPSQSSKVRVLIIDGVNNHDWMGATHAVAEILAATTVFSVDVSTTPPRSVPPEAWDSWRPDFSRYDVVINNFNGGEKADGIEWPIGVQTSLEKFVRHGGGL